VLEYVGRAHANALAQDANGVREALAALREKGTIKKMGRAPLLSRDEELEMSRSVVCLLL